MLENVVLFRISSLHTDTRHYNTKLTAERDVINILTIIARRLAALLAFRATDDYDTGTKLFTLLSFSRTMNAEGRDVTWDLGSYLRDVAGRLPEQDPGTGISMRRLISVLHALRPLCAPRDDLHAAWEHIGLAPDDDYQESFWDANSFELGPLLNPDAHIASLNGASSPEEIASGDGAPSHAYEGTTPPAVQEEWTALHWLDAAMH